MIYLAITRVINHLIPRKWLSPICQKETVVQRRSEDRPEIQITSSTTMAKLKPLQWTAISCLWSSLWTGEMELPEHQLISQRLLSSHQSKLFGSKWRRRLSRISPQQYRVVRKNRDLTKTCSIFMSRIEISKLQLPLYPKLLPLNMPTKI